MAGVPVFWYGKVLLALPGVFLLIMCKLMMIPCRTESTGVRYEYAGYMQGTQRRQPAYAHCVCPAEARPNTQAVQLP